MDDDEIYRRVIDGLEAMDLLRRPDVRFRRIHRTKAACVVRTFDYQVRPTKALEYIRIRAWSALAVTPSFEYINMDEAIRRGLAIAHSLDSEAEQVGTATR